MNKSSTFAGKPIFSQLLSLIEKSIINETIIEHKMNYVGITAILDAHIQKRSRIKCQGISF
jgi:hypothetical protein